MNRKYARKLAETITNEQIKQMFDNAKEGIKDWTKRSDVNKGLSKGTAWNILAKDFDMTVKHHVLALTNMIWEFGDYLPEELKQPPGEKRKLPPPTHHDPIFKP